MTDHQQHEPAQDGAPGRRERLTANEPARPTPAWEREIWQAFAESTEGKSLERDGVRLLIREIVALRAALAAAEQRAEQAESVLAASRAETARLLNALAGADQALNGGDTDYALAGAAEIVREALSAVTPAPGVAYPDRCCRGQVVCDHDTTPAMSPDLVPVPGQPGLYERVEPATDDGARGRPLVEDHGYLTIDFDYSLPCRFSWRSESDRTYCEKPYTDHVYPILPMEPPADARPDREDAP